MKNPNSFGNGDDGGDFHNKVNFLAAAMREEQPQFKDFRGFYPEGTIRFDMRKLDDKNRRDEEENWQNGMSEASDDDYVPAMEALLAYSFGAEQMLPGCETFSFLASEFDDKIMGTDTVIGVVFADGERMYFAIDAATGTNPKNIAGKFQKNAKPPVKYGQRPAEFEKTPAFCGGIKYGKYRGELISVPAAPRFVLGMAPIKLEEAYDGIEFENGIPVNRGDWDVNKAEMRFKFASEMFEQTKMQLFAMDALGANKLRDANKDGLLKLLGSLKEELKQMCGEGTEKEDVDGFSTKEYVAIQRRCARGNPEDKRDEGDVVYRNIINMTREYHKYLYDMYRKNRQKMGQEGMKRG